MCAAAICALLFGNGELASAQEKLRLLIIDGQNNHNWKETTPYLKSVLEATGRFDVTVSTTPPKEAPPDAWKTFRPDFKAFAAVLSNYNGEAWPEPVRTSLENYVHDGGGLVIVHAANNAFPDWPAFNEMIGLGWRGAGFGDRLVLDDQGKEQRVPKGEGPGAGHGAQHAYSVVIRDRMHPVTRDMPAEWLHPKDELYHGQRGPARSMHVLATAFSSPDSGGTGAHEPLVWWIPYGRGRVFTNLLGHVGGNSDDLTAMRCLGFQALLTRGSEWAATGEVTIPLPQMFPTAEKVSLAPES